MKSNIKNILVPAFTLLVICVVSTVLLALTNSITAAKIVENSKEKEMKSLSAVISAEKFDKSDDGYYIAKSDSEALVGYVFTEEAKGYGGAVSVMIGVDTEGKVTGIEILSHSETPGLGANSTKPEFKSRFIGKSGVLAVNKTSNEGKNIQAITAATITSKAVTSAVNSALAEYEAIAKR